MLFVISSASNSFAQTLPKPAGRVNDFANVIDPAVEAEIDHRLDRLEQTTSSEIAVATIKSLDGVASSDYANRLFKEWGVGQARADNGVLVLIAIDDRDMAIEVGYGLEGVLPDGLAGQIIRDDFTPRFRDGDYPGGIRDGVMRLADVVEKQQVLTPEELAQFNADSASPDLPVFIGLPFFGLLVAIGFGLLGVGLRSKTGFPLLFGWGAGLLCLLGACSYLPGQQEMARAEEVLRTVGDVVEVHFTCPGTVLASDRLCADVVMKDGARLRFDRVGFNSFGSTAMNVFVSKASGLVPRIASCGGVSTPNFHRTGPLGHHFQPTLIDMKDAVSRYKELLEEVEFWPQCPQYWEVQDRLGENFRYCARGDGSTGEPPRPDGCR